MIEKEEKPEDILERSKNFAILNIKMTEHFPRNAAGFKIASQIVSSSTSTAANIKEARAGRSRSEFISCMGISLREANETILWLEIRSGLNWIETKYIKAMIREGQEIANIIASIIINTKNKK